MSQNQDPHFQAVLKSCGEFALTRHLYIFKTKDLQKTLLTDFFLNVLIVLLFFMLKGFEMRTDTMQLLNPLSELGKHITCVRITFQTLSLSLEWVIHKEAWTQFNFQSKLKVEVSHLLCFVVKKVSLWNSSY